ncbi:hypothetical protein [Marinimicrobium sp. ABcell2]|uniref:hypothetical protein n=1 Tax=Marinimicrobium sp. ABcell2 TaxID=3069751 RepID=UPI0027AE134F|nr:hypothetical protein [Marinimicrobium sp. ABcell2]MDQ2077353.1 hypothetical protein [Marinimicrobium sp. ABcell2]
MKIDTTGITVKNEKDIKAIAEQDRFYSAAISPLTIFIVVYAVSSAMVFYMNGDLLGVIFAAAPAGLAMVFAFAIHHLLFWSRFGPNWKLYFTCALNGKKYYIVKDGARRYRVYTADNRWANGISTDDIYDSTFVDWLKNEQPLHGELATS